MFVRGSLDSIEERLKNAVTEGEDRKAKLARAEVKARTADQTVTYLQLEKQVILLQLEKDCEIEAAYLHEYLQLLKAANGTIGPLEQNVQDILRYARCEKIFLAQGFGIYAKQFKCSKKELQDVATLTNVLKNVTAAIHCARSRDAITGALWQKLFDINLDAKEISGSPSFTLRALGVVLQLFAASMLITGLAIFALSIPIALFIEPLALVTALLGVAIIYASDSVAKMGVNIQRRGDGYGLSRALTLFATVTTAAPEWAGKESREPMQAEPANSEDMRALNLA